MSEAVEVGKRLQRVDGSLHQERQKRDAVWLLLVGLAGVVEFLAVFLDLGNVRIVVVGDVRNVEPRPMQERSRDALDAHHRLDLDRAELREVDSGNFGNSHAARRRAGGRALGSATERGFQILLGDAALFARPLDRGEIDIEFARHATDARTGMRAGKVRDCRTTGFL